MAKRTDIQLLEQSAAGGAKACQSCAVGCRMLSIAPPANGGLLSAEGVHGTGVLKAVIWLFGVPLLLLLGTVWWLESQQMTAQPLLSGSVIAGIGWLVFVVAKRRGDKLLNMVQPQHAALCGKSN